MYSNYRACYNCVILPSILDLRVFFLSYLIIAAVIEIITRIFPAAEP